MKYKTILFLFFLSACSPHLKTLNIKEPYAANGFAYIYNEADFNKYSTYFKEFKGKEEDAKNKIRKSIFSLKDKIKNKKYRKNDNELKKIIINLYDHAIEQFKKADATNYNEHLIIGLDERKEMEKEEKVNSLVKSIKTRMFPLSEEFSSTNINDLFKLLDIFLIFTWVVIGTTDNFLL